ncbi:MAG: FMN-binding glutamate synthase family protein [Rhodobacteraceae bacterium]|nr:FMN-binding glutamate synthase family protein [Paracoccaceae bacterium]MCY4195787.1 FMN-binding glutamate synthase family protein [Paracoccaceae bacterium]MCY4327976.1 FMN-binding glutamate synthase family protein [Paracoccaceae bacterium]
MLVENFLITSLQILSAFFIFCTGLAAAGIVALFFLDVSQTKDAVRRNYPVLGRFRYLFTMLGEFFRQYFFAMDREEMPFNRAEREWVHRATGNHDNTVAFGSTKNLSPPGTAIFVNYPFPTLDKDAVDMIPMQIGPHCRMPYNAPSFFNISGMSYGALSTPAVRALSHGAALAGCWYNTGEGGLSTHHLSGNCDIVFQIGTAKYGVRDEAGNLSDEKLCEVASHERVRMFELKLSQGAKPGKGGILPGTKVTEEIAKIRGIPVGQDSISPNRHPEVGGISDLLDMISHIRSVTGKPVGFKSVFGNFGWLEDMCQEVHARGIEHAPDFITVDSGDGGTGAAPMPLMDNVGLPIKESLPQTSDVLHRFALRHRIKLIASGKLVTPSEVAWAIATGADFVTSARGFMFSLGCIQSLKCNKNTCPTGITTHNPRLQKGLNPADKAVKVANYCKNIVHEVQVISHSCGVVRPRLMGRDHVRIVQRDGKSIPMSELYQRPSVSAEFLQTSEADIERTRQRAGIWAEDVTALYERYRTHQAVIRQLAGAGYAIAEIASYLGKTEKMVQDALVKEAA